MIFYGHSSVGRAPAWHAGGQRFESAWLHLDQMVDWYKKSKPIDNFNHFYHHEAHAASCLILSPFNNGICLTVDGVGDFESLAIWKFDRLNKNKPLEKIYSSTTMIALDIFMEGLLDYLVLNQCGMKEDNWLSSSWRSKKHYH